jgi:hypothetical protein
MQHLIRDHFWSSFFETPRRHIIVVEDLACRAAYEWLSPFHTLLHLLSGKVGASLEELQVATGWQAHSVRGFLSGTVRRKMGLELISEPDRSGTRRYRLASTPKKGSQ